MKYLVKVLLVVVVILTATLVFPTMTSANKGSAGTEVIIHLDPSLQKDWNFLQVYSPRCARDPLGCLPSELTQIHFKNGVAKYKMNYDYVATFWLQKEYYKAEFRLAAVVGSLDSNRVIPSVVDVYVYSDGRYDSYHDGSAIVLSNLDAHKFLEEVFILGKGAPTVEDSFKQGIRVYAHELWPHDW